ncbi:uncharacterized protein ACIB01_015388 [Guaruba guarouba]
MAGFFWAAARARGFRGFSRPRGSLSRPAQVFHGGHVHSPDCVLASAASARGSNWCRFPPTRQRLRVSRAVLASPRSTGVHQRSHPLQLNACPVAGHLGKRR